MSRIEKRALGRGLNALFGDEEPEAITAAVPTSSSSVSENLSGNNRRMIGIAQVVPGKYQPRHVFDTKTIEELSASIQQHGLIQPLLVRPLKDGLYEIVAGERRWRAAQKAMLHEVPVIIREMEDGLALEIALIENLQREDLNPVDEAQALSRLMDEFSYTQEQVADKVGKSRSYVANMLRLTELNPQVAQLVKHSQLSAGHARALLTLPAEQQFALAHKAIENHLNVRQLEKLVAGLKGPVTNKVSKLGGQINKATQEKDVNTRALEREISNLIGMTVAVDMTSNQAGKLSIEFKSLDQLDELIRKLSAATQT